MAQVMAQVRQHGWETAQGWHRAGGGMGDGWVRAVLRRCGQDSTRAGDGTGNGMGNGGAGDGTGDGAGGRWWGQGRE